MPTYQVTYLHEAHVEGNRLRNAAWNPKQRRSLMDSYSGHLFGGCPAFVERIRRLHPDMQPWRATAGFDDVRHADRGKGPTEGQKGNETRLIASHVVVTAEDDERVALFAPYVPMVLRAIRDGNFAHLAKAEGSVVTPSHRIDCVAVMGMAGAPLTEEGEGVVGIDADGSPLVRVGVPDAIAEAFATAVMDCDESLHPIRDLEREEDGLSMLIWSDPDGTVWSDPAHHGEALDAIATFMRSTIGKDDIKKPLNIVLPPLPRSATLKAATRRQRLEAAIAALEADARLHQETGVGEIAKAQIARFKESLHGRT